MATYLGIDVGTSSVKAVLLDEDQALIAEGSAPVEVLRPRPMWSEQDPEEWWQAAQKAVAQVRSLAPQAFSQLEGIGLSGQQHSATLVDRHGSVLRPAILWNDGRCGRECGELLERVPDFMVRSSNTTMPGFTAPKLLWVARHEPEIFGNVAKVLLPKDYLRYRLSGDYVSDMSDSAGTLWLDVGRRCWDDVLLQACDMKRAQMPDLVEGAEISAYLSSDVAAVWGLKGRKIPIAGGGGDNASSAVGIGAIGPGDGFLSLGTSGVLFVSTDRLVSLPERTLHGFCHALPQRWHGMVVALSAASALAWLAGLTGHQHDVAGLIEKAKHFASDPGRREAAPVFLPYLTGERTPHNDPNATAGFSGLRAEHDAGALAYAVLEGVAFALADGLDVLKAADAAPRSCMLVGGGSRSAYWNGLLADVLGLSLDLPEGAEIGAAFGAARLGMVAAGAGTVEAICHKPSIRARFETDPEKAPIFAERRERYLGMYPAAAKT
ncbi:xylulokinase [Phyllobacterium phragmitis]|uniref:Xylulose kinase n=1 Tax=Phyllobacterium phragmitis TaxID=2670329 RepID=A0A2S9IPP7_9HYPH|nr:xylulokinase [Phyllobacterium phragmitis]PRD42506.1 xylulokinase [Phyllobacterium phragmitis]